MGEEYNQDRKKSFLINYSWISIIFIVLGGIFVTIAIIFQLIPLDPRTITVRINGILQPANQETVRIFRLIFLLTFGIVGCVSLIVAGIILIRRRNRQQFIKSVKENGTSIIAEVTDYIPTAVRVNRRRLMRLYCSYTDAKGNVYIFKSDILRLNPIPYLKDGKVKVYYEWDNKKRYFVDIDESVGVGANVFEL